MKSDNLKLTPEDHKMIHWLYRYELDTWDRNRNRDDRDESLTYFMFLIRHLTKCIADKSWW